MHDINYIEPGSQKTSFFEDAAQIGLIIGSIGGVLLLMYFALNACINAF